MTNLGFICKGNERRSYLAEVLAKEKDVPALNISSRGLVTPKHNHISYRMETALRNEGHEPIHGFSPQEASLEYLTAQDILLCMSRRQVETVKHELRKQREGRIIETLPWFAEGSDYDIPDIGDRKVVRRDLRKGIGGWLLRKRGYVDQVMDEDGLIRVFQEMVREIDYYVAKAVQRIISEGLVTV
ncbi:hypothetical protein GF351_01810 [Candidatus Woesearchaeota archaeon]|nr:hypothetical protein [Candidatus Woesearchaeota archaeon]